MSNQQTTHLRQEQATNVTDATSEQDVDYMSWIFTYKLSMKELNISVLNVHLAPKGRTLFKGTWSRSILGLYLIVTCVRTAPAGNTLCKDTWPDATELKVGSRPSNNNYWYFRILFYFYNSTNHVRTFSLHILCKQITNKMFWVKLLNRISKCIQVSELEFVPYVGSNILLIKVNCLTQNVIYKLRSC